MLNEEMTNPYRKSDSDLAFQSQLESYYYFKRKAENAVEEELVEE